jgi:hypothetical protein
MVYLGTIQNGVVVFPSGVQLPEGSPVRVELVQRQTEHSTNDDVLIRMGEYAIDTGIPDLGVNIDHYLYGHPKKVLDVE